MHCISYLAPLNRPRCRVHLVTPTRSCVCSSFCLFREYAKKLFFTEPANFLAGVWFMRRQLLSWFDCWTTMDQQLSRRVPCGDTAPQPQTDWLSRETAQGEVFWSGSSLTLKHTGIFSFGYVFVRCCRGDIPSQSETLFGLKTAGRRGDETTARMRKKVPGEIIELDWRFLYAPRDECALFRYDVWILIHERVTRYFGLNYQCGQTAHMKFVWLIQSEWQNESTVKRKMPPGWGSSSLRRT